MNPLNAGHFEAFFHALHDKPPFPWQRRLAHDVYANRNWPQIIDLPTASGKTACIDIAIFAMAALGNEAPRRILFIVDRRVIVQDAFERARRIGAKLKEALNGHSAVLKNVAENLCELAGSPDSDPLACYELHGGAYRDESWVENPLQPTLIASTVDQIGSRLLFRGYSVPDRQLSMHAGLVANDSILFLDEAHCSKPFGETVRSVARYLGPDWAAEPLRLPFHFVEMTATPSRDGGTRFTIDAEDRKNETIHERLTVGKPAKLIEVKARKNDTETIAAELIKQALRLAQNTSATRAAIIVNRVFTAKLVHRKLIEQGHDALLVIGRMRPYDREKLNYSFFKTDTQRTEGEPTHFIVSTQCVEVGADLDFDVLVTECAGIDALVQRFGRLDRVGAFGRAQGAVVVGSWQGDPKNRDAVYGSALATTWKWLKSIAKDNEQVDFGIENDQAGTVAQLLEALPPGDAAALRLETKSAPVLLPAHLDTLVQTNPRPEPEPSVELFLHGPEHRAADVNVLWRSDLGDKPEVWPDIVALCPPTSREAMPVAFGTFLKWLGGEKADPEQSDIEGFSSEAYDGRSTPGVKGLVWRNGKASRFATGRDLRPGETIILPSKHFDAAAFFGYIPEDSPADIGDICRLDLRRELTLRIHSELVVGERGAELLKRLREEEWSEDQFVNNIQNYADAFPAHTQRVLKELGHVQRPQIEDYPDNDSGTSAWIFHGWLARGKSHSEKLFLETHLGDVARQTRSHARRMERFSPPLIRAAELHDYGKVDVRFQTWLRGGDEMAARFSPIPIAKSGKPTLPKPGVCGLPDGFRHELLSLLFAEKAVKTDDPYRELIFHLIASQHGYCRAFAPVVIDTNPECVEFQGIEICAEERRGFQPHRLGSGISDRFWALTRRYGWWGLAYLEALLRLADWNASKAEHAEADLE